MSGKRDPNSPPNTDLPEDDLDYVGEEVDDDDSEDFVPGDDDFVDDNTHEPLDEDEEAVVPLLDGHLFYGTKHALHYQGEGFHLAASEPVPWNVLLASDAPTSSSSSSSGTAVTTSCSLTMAGPCDFETAGAKATPRKLKVTFTRSDPPHHPHSAAFTSNNNGSSNNGKSSKFDAKPSATAAAVIQDNDDDDDDEDQKKPSSSTNDDSKMPSVYYSVYGTQIDSHGGDLMEFMGGFFPPTTQTEKVGLVCQVRMMAPPAAPTKAAPVAAVAARVQDDDDDGDDDDDDAAQVDYDELIALHEDAGMSVADLKKRFGDGAVAAASSPDKKRKFEKKPPPPPPVDDDDDDDDDDYGF